jgi:hypothetical protein
MNRIVKGITLLAGAAVALGATACSDGTADDANRLVGVPRQTSYDPNSLAAEGNTQHHFQDPNTGDNGITDPAIVHADDQLVGSPEVVARLHACGKIPYASLGSILSTRGVSLTSNAKSAPNTAGTLYGTGAAALGVANYAGRVPEMVIGSTSALAKMFDIFVAASAEIQKNLTNSSACSGQVIADANGVFSKDAISCILGKPATDAYVTIANQIVTAAPDVSTGVQVAIAAMLEAAHTCE